MRETSNYKLNQWDKTDRIEMEDFNEDNQKIDAALAAEKQARESADAAQASALRGELAAEKQARENADAAQLSTLRNENLWVKIGETELSGTASQISVPVENPSRYERLIVQFSTSGPKVLYFSINGGTSASLFNNSYASVSCTGQAELVRGYPSGVYALCSNAMYDDENIWKLGSNFYLRSTGFASLSALGLRAGSGETLAAGTHVVVYGLKK